MLVVVTGAIAPVLHVEAVVADHLRALGRDIAFALLGDSACDEALTCLEVVVQALRLIALPAVAELWVGRSLPCAIEDIVCVDEVAVEVEAHKIGIHPLVLIVHGTGPKEVGQALPDEDHRVLRLVGDDIIEALTLATTALTALGFLCRQAEGIKAKRAKTVEAIGTCSERVGLLLQAIKTHTTSALEAI